jgi:hypothetical protein
LEAPLMSLNHLADFFMWRLKPSLWFTTASAYRAFFIGQHPIPGAKLLRKTRAPGRCKFFVWLVLHDRCWTAARRKRPNLQESLLRCMFATPGNHLARPGWLCFCPGGLVQLASKMELAQVGS